MFLDALVNFGSPVIFRSSSDILQNLVNFWSQIDVLGVLVNILKTRLISESSVVFEA